MGYTKNSAYNAIKTRLEYEYFVPLKAYFKRVTNTKFIADRPNIHALIDMIRYGTARCIEFLCIEMQNIQYMEPIVAMKYNNMLKIAVYRILGSSFIRLILLFLLLVNCSLLNDERHNKLIRDSLC